MEKTALKPGIRSRIFSTDHRVIARQYFFLSLFAVVVGMVLSWLMRIHLAWTNYPIPGLHLLFKAGAAGDVMTPELYLQLMTMHATFMVFFVLCCSVSALSFICLWSGKRSTSRT